MVSDKKIVVKFDPSYRASGTTGFMTWRNPRMKQALEAMFALHAREKLTGIEITNEGITARFAFVE